MQQNGGFSRILARVAYAAPRTPPIISGCVFNIFEDQALNTQSQVRVVLHAIGVA